MLASVRTDRSQQKTRTIRLGDDSLGKEAGWCFLPSSSGNLYIKLKNYIFVSTLYQDLVILGWKFVCMLLWGMQLSRLAKISRIQEVDGGEGYNETDGQTGR